MKANHIIFVENRNQVLWIKETTFYDSDMMLVALTADALQALEEFQYPCYSISEITDTYALVQEEDKYISELLRLTEEIETYLGEHYPSAQFEGPGFLSGDYYTLQYSISAIAKRAYLMREAIRFFCPNRVTAFQGEVIDWFVDDGYIANPWDEILDFFAKEYNFKINFILINPEKNSEINPEKRKRPISRYVKYPFISIIRIKREITDSISQILSKKETRLEEYNGLKIVFMTQISSEWRPAVNLFGANKHIKIFEVEPIRFKKDQWWSTICSSSIKSVFSHEKYELIVESPVFNAQESKDLIHHFEQWLKERQEPPKILVLGMNIFPALIPQIKTMIIQGPEITRYSDKLAKSILKKIEPQIACFSCITILYERRFAFQCEKNNVPVVCYQHGGIGYNVQIQPKNEGLDPACSDFVLSYGVENPRTNAIFPVKAKFIPIGSSRIEKMLQKSTFLKKMDCKLNILWIAEESSNNTRYATITEDIKRYKIQKDCLTILSKNKANHIIYRPFGFQLFKDGTSTWIKNENIPSLKIDSDTPLDELIVNSDVVIVDISSMTTWGEVLCLKKPMILYFDPLQTPLAPFFIPDLESACCWCKSDKELFIAINSLITNSETFLSELKTKDTTSFIKKYILHNGNSANNVCSFLNSLRQNDR